MPPSQPFGPLPDTSRFVTDHEAQWRLISAVMRILTATVALTLLCAAPAVAEESTAVPSSAPVAAADVKVPDFRTQAWLVADADSGDILAGQSYDVQRPPASTLKTLTALTLLPRLQYDSTYEAIPNEALTEGAHVGVLAGNDYRVSELFHGMLMRSGNDAAVALADAYGYQRTLDAMNAEAQRIGATSTVAKSPNGLDRDGQVTTAADLAQIYRAAIRLPNMQEILTAKTAEFPGRPPIQPTDERGSYAIYNHDTLLTSDYPGFLGAKSGFTSRAGRTYVAGAERDGRTLVVSLLGIGGGTTETARRVLDWSFDNLGALTPVGSLPALPDAPDVTAEPAASHGEDIAPMPPDAQTINDVTAIAQEAMATAARAGAVQQAVVSEDPAAVATANPAQDSGLDPQQVAQDAIAAAALAAGEPVAENSTGVAASIGAAAAEPVIAVPAPAEPESASQRGFFATLLIGLFRTFMWLLLFSGIAVVGLRIRAVRRQRARREAYLRATAARVAENLPADSSFGRDPARTR